MKQQIHQQPLSTGFVIERRNIRGLDQQLVQQGRYAENLTLCRQAKPGRSGPANIGVQHGDRAVHAHHVGYPCRYPDGSLRRYHPVALVGIHRDHTASCIGKLPAVMPVQGKVLPVGIVNGRDDSVAGDIFADVGFNFAHGPNLMIYDLIVQAGRCCKCA